MKHILLVLVAAFIIFFVIFIGFGPKAEVKITAPEVQKTTDYKRPVREGNCWRQWDSAGNSFLVCH